MGTKKNDIKNTEVVSSVGQEIEEKTQEVLDEDLLIEDDGDFFWILQRVVWGVLKGIFLLIAIIFLIWFIWSGDDIFNTNEITIDFKPIQLKPIDDTEKQKEVDNINSNLPILESKKINSERSLGTIEIIKTAYRIDKKQQIKYSGIISESILWLRKAKTLGEISPHILRIESPIKRAQKIESILLEADSILNKAKRLKNILLTQTQNLLRNKRTLEEEIKKLDDQLFLQISQFNAHNIDDILEKKIEKQKLLISLTEQGKIRETLLKNINSFENLLKQKWIPLIRPVNIQAPVR